MYIEGWAQTSALSILATYQGPDTMGREHLLQAVSSPLVPSSALPLFSECLPGGNAGDSNFTICAFKANGEIDLSTVKELQSNYLQVQVK